MTSNFDDVGAFHEKFSLDNVTSGTKPHSIDHDLLAFRREFLREELNEFEEACATQDLPQMFDALIDLVYVAMGTAHLLGLPWQSGWDVVQRANMQKIRATHDGSDSKRNSGWDVVKPPGWTPPDLTSIINQVRDNLHVCPQCRRDFDKISFKEVFIDRMGSQWVSIHCVCGRVLATRPA